MLVAIVYNPFWLHLYSECPVYRVNYIILGFIYKFMFFFIYITFAQCFKAWLDIYYRLLLWFPLGYFTFSMRKKKKYNNIFLHLLDSPIFDIYFWFLQLLPQQTILGAASITVWPFWWHASNVRDFGDIVSAIINELLITKSFSHFWLFPFPPPKLIQSCTF